MTESCIICGSAAEHLYTKFDWKQDFNFYKCSNCTHVFIFPLPSDSILEAFYNQEYYVPDFQKLKVRNKGRFVLNYISEKNKQMLEIGCSYGYFLEFMREQNVLVDGLELSQKASQSAKEKGFNVINGNLESLPITNKYQSIFLFDVLEHIPNLKNFLFHLNQILDRNGEIFLTVPNQNSLEFKLFKKYWEWSSPPAHLHFFNIKSFTCLLKEYDLTLEVSKSFKGDSAGNIFFHFYDSTKRMVLFNLGCFIYGKNNFLEKKAKYNLKQKENRQYSKNEFSGLTYLVYKCSTALNFIDRMLRNENNEPTLFLKVRKSESR
jgi:SAM-dependent methyltransferase